MYKSQEPTLVRTSLKSKLEPARKIAQYNKNRQKLPPMNIEETTAENFGNEVSLTPIEDELAAMDLIKGASTRKKRAYIKND